MNNRLLGNKLPILLLIALIVSMVMTVSHVSARDKMLQTEKQKVPFRELLTSLEQKFNVRFNYSTELVGRVSVESFNISKLKKERLIPFLQQVLVDKGLSVEKIDEMLYVIRALPKSEHNIPELRSSESAKQQNISGVVTDRITGLSIPGVSVVVKGSSVGTSTDKDGKYSLSNVPNNAVLVFASIGYETKEEAVNGRSNVSVQLEASLNALEEVVVTALGIRREEKSLGYAVQKVSGKALETVKGVDVGTSLTGKVSGLVVKNSTEFFARPTVELRGEGALLVIDGVPYGNMTLRDIPTDDIESLDVLKGPTASALYGSRAAGGVLLVTTKKGSGGGLSVNINSNTMFQTGFLAIPEVQGSYGRGQNGQIDNDYVWGPRLDAGNTARDWNPVTKQFEDNRPLVSVGKDNLRNFIETGLVANNNISVSQGGQNGSFRASLNHVYNKGQFPNAKLNMYNFTLGGEMKVGDKFNLEGHMGLSRRDAPQIWGSGYGNQGYIYQLTMWTGPEYDIRDYKEYWKIPFESQNWMYTNWYDNPYLIAYEKLNGIQQNTINGNLTANYKFTKNLKLLVRLGYDVYSNTETWRNPTANIYSTRGGWNARGYFAINKDWGWSTNNDAMLSYNTSLGKWTFDAMAGGTVYYWVDESLDAATRNGLTSPTYYSLSGSVEPPTITPYLGRRQVNSLFARGSIGWNNTVYLDFTGRNDWNSSQPETTRDYFYPSIGSSVILSEFIRLPKAVDMWKIRGSWATFKTPGDIYAINRLYSTTTAAWNNLNSASYPSNLLGSNLLPSSQRTWEVGTAAYFFKKRLNVDVTYFNKYYYNRQTSVPIPGSSGFSSTLVNTDETYVRRGLEITLEGSLIKKNNFEWTSVINWSNQHRYYVNIDPQYSADDPWTRKGERLDAYTASYWLTDPSGNIIHNNGYPVESDYDKKYGYGDPDFSFGVANNFRVGDFQFGLSVDGRIGGLMYNYVWDKSWDTGTNPETDNQYRYDEVVNGLTNYVGKGVKVVSGTVEYDNYGNITSDTRQYAPNDVNASYQNYAQNFRGGDMGIQSESFVKIREVSAGYRIPTKFMKRTGVKSASVALTAQNLFLFTNFKFSDPDVDDENLNSPSQRMIGLNVKVGF